MHIFKILTKMVVGVNKNYIELNCFNRFGWYCGSIYLRCPGSDDV